jgi:hypothetical protein
MKLSGRIRLEDDVYGGVCGAYVRRKFNDGLADVRCAFLLCDKDVSGW